MCESAALLVEHRLPAVPWRQWVLSFEGPLAVRLGYALSTSATLHPGLVIVVQRFRNDLGLFVHLHALLTDGCFEAPDDKGPDGRGPDDDAQEVRFLPAKQLAGDHLLRTLQRLHADLAEHVL